MGSTVQPATLLSQPNYGRAVDPRWLQPASGTTVTGLWSAASATASNAVDLTGSGNGATCSNIKLSSVGGNSVLAFNGSSSKVEGSIGAVNEPTAWTAVFYGIVNSVSSDAGLVSKRQGSGWVFALRTTKTLQFYTGSAWVNSSITMPLGVPIMAIATYDGATLTQYGNGSLSASAQTVTKTATKIDVGMWDSSFGFLSGSVYYAGLLPGALGLSQAQQLVSRPWSLWPSAQRRLYFGAAAGGFSGTPGTGSLVKTGQIPTNVLGFHFSPTTGSVVKTGQVTTLTKAFVFTPATGSLVKTGQVPTLTRKFTFTPGTGSLVKTGQIPILTRTFNFTPGTGSIVKTGQQPTLYAPFTPKTGAIVKTGHIPILTISSFGAALAPHSWFVKAIGVKTKGSVHSQVDSDSGDTP